MIHEEAAAPMYLNWAPVMRAAAERCGVRLRDVVGRSYDFQSGLVTVKYGEVRTADEGGSVVITGQASFIITDEDYPPPCPTCGKR